MIMISAFDTLCASRAVTPLQSIVLRSVALSPPPPPVTRAVAPGTLLQSDYTNAQILIVVQLDLSPNPQQ
jgi:hypothetical protein